jgi:hypothetical protein
MVATPTVGRGAELQRQLQALNVLPLICAAHLRR